nr:unnamed protein product [Leishmania braziliensis]
MTQASAARWRRATKGRSTGSPYPALSRLALLPYVEYVLRLFFRVGYNLLGLFDNIYAGILFIFCYRYLTPLEHTVLYYGAAKLLRVMQPELGDYHARSIEQDITVSLITLLQSFGHLTWFHFCTTFRAFTLWGFPTPFLLGLVSVVLALFPLVRKWLSPCSIAFVHRLVQLISLINTKESSFSGNNRPGEAYPPAAVPPSLLSSRPRLVDHGSRFLCGASRTSSTTHGPSVGAWPYCWSAATNGFCASLEGCAAALSWRLLVRAASSCSPVRLVQPWYWALSPTAPTASFSDP